MALDTLIKRASALNFIGGRLLPPPDGIVDQGDRQTLVDMYSGILAGGAPAPGEEVPFMEGTRGLVKELAQSLMGSANGL